MSLGKAAQAQPEPAANVPITNTNNHDFGSPPQFDGVSPHATSLPQAWSNQGYATSPATVDNGYSNDILLPPSAVCFHLATLYFDYVHDQLHTLFQKPAFMTDMVMNKTPPVIMFSVVALSARLVDCPRSES